VASLIRPDTATSAPEGKPATYARFSRWQRIEHAILIASFTTLAVTGLPQKFADAPISQTIVAIFGGVEAIRIVHRLAAIALMAQSIYHVVAVLYRVLVRRASLSMFPVLEDFKHLVQDVLFYLGLRKRKGYYGRYSYAEKAEYLAVVWGTLIMIITGFMMWNPIATAQVLPGEVIPAAKVAHGGEAVLAVLAIILWHFYNVHIKHLNKSMFTGALTREEMQHEHPAELALIEAGRADKPLPAQALRRRQRVFVPIAAALTLTLGFGLIRFITFEQTAIDTAPRGEAVRAFVPFTPTPSPTPSPTLPPTATPTPAPATPTPAASAAAVEAWSGGIDQLIAARCAACHVNAALGELSLKTYADALKGGRSGPAVAPGDPDASVLIQIQSKGGHAGQLSDEELAKFIAWIETGAPEE
jgi:cytochrome b subunit of formate dehydrogenase/mono/diheme cytochrome c family protein